MNLDMKLGIFGAGFSGRAIADRFLKEGADVWGTTRDSKKAESLQAAGIKPVLLDSLTLSDALRTALADTTHLVISIAPSRNEDQSGKDNQVDPVLAALGDNRLPDLAPKLQWIGYLSTVGVYGNHDGAWVDEATPSAPLSARSRQRTRAEAQWLDVGNRFGLTVALFRLSGIYGPGRNALVTADQNKGRRLVKQGQVFNRIHVGDIAEALWLAASKKAQGAFNITDDEPAPPQDVVAFAHELMGKTPPPELDFETADLTPMARSFYGENKRVSNARSRSELGLNYAWPNYRVALQRMWEEDSWR